MKVIRRVVAGIIIAVVVVYAGSCIYANVRTTASKPKIPTATEAPYAFIIQNTNNVILSASYTKSGSAYVLHGYWEPYRNGYRQRKGTITLDPAKFGPVTFAKRPPDIQGG